MIKNIQASLSILRQQKPLILCLTNYVTMDFMANSLLALGALPLMSSCDDELEELIQISHAVMINIGTLDSPFLERCLKAAGIAKSHHKPLILDPVGSGASKLRTNGARTLMKHAQIIRGNASEITSLINEQTKTQGVESLLPTEQAKNTAKQLAHLLDCTVVVSGEEDYITDGQQQASLQDGSPMMPLITGMGCTLTAVIAAFQAIIPDSYLAAKQATAYFGLCGSLAQQKAKAPGFFRTAFIDELYHANLKAFQPQSGLQQKTTVQDPLIRPVGHLLPVSGEKELMKGSDLEASHHAQ